MTLDSEQSAIDCQRLHHDRSAASRAYYAAYQAATAIIHYLGKSVPPTIKGQKREAWQHERTPKILSTDLKGIIRRHAQRNRIETILSSLYKVRIQADYVSSSGSFDDEQRLQQAMSNMAFIIKTAKVLLPQGDQS